MDTRTTRAPGRLRREWINIPATFKAEGFTPKGSGGPWAELGGCPFHNDHHPSLRGNLETGRIRCMSCGWSGDLVAFIMQRHGLGFRQAAQHLGAWEELGEGQQWRPLRSAHSFRRGGAR